MKISFSTLACPDFTWTDIYSMAKDLGALEALRFMLGGNFPP